MTLAEKINQDTIEALDRQNIKLSTEVIGFENSDFGAVSVRIDVDVNISHIENFYEALQKLTNYSNSPISEDGYTGTDIHSPYGSDLIYYIMEYSYIFDEHRDTSIKILKENCDEKMVDDIINRVDQLYSLGFHDIALSYSSFTEEQFEKRVKEEENEITAGYYELEEDKILKIKYEILNIKLYEENKND